VSKRGGERAPAGNEVNGQPRHRTDHPPVHNRPVPPQASRRAWARPRRASTSCWWALGGDDVWGRGVGGQGGLQLSVERQGGGEG
jgi:hypothetical protein